MVKVESLAVTGRIGDSSMFKKSTSSTHDIMHIELEKHLVTEENFLDRLAGRLGLGHDKERALQITKRVFQLLRQRLSIEKSRRLMRQLPSPLVAWYMEDWEPLQEAVFFKTLLQFAHELVQSERRDNLGNFYGVEEVLVAIRAVLETIASFLSSNEIEEMISLMPGELKQLMQDWISNLGQDESPPQCFNATDLTQ
jgi:uncharacterized protein (DUF2267 family)